MDELLKLLNEGKFEEALEEFRKLYKKTNNIIALYYITMIGYNNNLASVDELKKNFKILYNYSDEMRLNTIEFYTLFLLDIQDYNTCLTISKNALDLKLNLPLYYYSFSKSLSKTCIGKKHCVKELDTALQYANKCLELFNLDENRKELIYSNIIDILILKKDFLKAYDLINKLYITMSNTTYIDYLKITTAVAENNKVLIDKMLSEISPNSENINIFLVISDYYFSRCHYLDVIKCNTKIKDFLKDPTEATKNIAIAYLYMGNYNKVIELLKTDKLNDGYTHNFILGDAYYNKGGKRNMLQAIEYYNKAASINKNDEPKLLNCIADCYCNMERPFELLNIISQIKKTDYTKNVLYYTAVFYRLTQQFNKAEIAIKKAKKAGYNNYKIDELSYSCFKKPEVLNNDKSYLFANNDTYSLLECLKIKMLGEHGFTIDIKEANKYEKKLEAKTDLNAYAYSVLSNYYLLIKDYKKSYDIALLGYNKYLNEEDNCQCCAAFVAYHKLYGLGCNKDVKGAYKICVDTEKRELGSINENLGHVYASCCIELGLELNHIYELLVKTTFRRYSVSRYAMLIKLAKRLKKDPSTFEKMFKQSLKHSSVKEKNFYKNNKDEFFMNNY